MAHTISALRRHKQSERRRIRNRSLKNALRSQIKRVLGAVDRKDGPASASALRDACRLLDRAAAKGILHPNNAARHKSRLVRRVRNGAPALTP